jgi:hypothetical protein
MVPALRGFLLLHEQQVLRAVAERHAASRSGLYITNPIAFSSTANCRFPPSALAEGEGEKENKAAGDLKYTVTLHRTQKDSSINYRLRCTILSVSVTS